MQPNNFANKRRRLCKNNKICNANTIQVISSDDEKKSPAMKKKQIIDLTSSDDEDTNNNKKDIKDLSHNEENKLLVRFSIVLH